MTLKRMKGHRCVRMYDRITPDLSSSDTICISWWFYTAGTLMQDLR